jgi:hypothetical protein
MIHRAVSRDLHLAASRWRWQIVELNRFLIHPSKDV